MFPELEVDAALCTNSSIVISSVACCGATQKTLLFVVAGFTHARNHRRYERNKEWREGDKVFVVCFTSFTIGYKWKDARNLHTQAPCNPIFVK